MIDRTLYGFGFRAARAAPLAIQRWAAPARSHTPVSRVYCKATWFQSRLGLASAALVAWRCAALLGDTSVSDSRTPSGTTALIHADMTLIEVSAPDATTQSQCSRQKQVLVGAIIAAIIPGACACGCNMKTHERVGALISAHCPSIYIYISSGALISAH